MLSGRSVQLVLTAVTRHTVKTYTSLLSPSRNTMDNVFLDTIHGIGEVAREVFQRAGYLTRINFMDYDGNDHKIQKALNEMKEEEPLFPASYWRNLNNRCIAIIYKIRSQDAAPFVPDYFMCPLTLNWFTDPVVTPSGSTYEREELIAWIKTYGTEPETGTPLTQDQLHPNRCLLEAQKYARTHMRLFFILARR